MATSTLRAIQLFFQILLKLSIKVISMLLIQYMLLIGVCMTVHVIDRCQRCFKNIMPFQYIFFVIKLNI